MYVIAEHTFFTTDTNSSINDLFIPVKKGQSVIALKQCSRSLFKSQGRITSLGTSGAWPPGAYYLKHPVCMRWWREGCLCRENEKEGDGLMDGPSFSALGSL